MNGLKEACDVLINQLLQVQKDEVFVITADLIADHDLVEEVFSSARSAGAKPLIVWMDTPDGVSESADPQLPSDALVALLSAADVWIELNTMWLLHSNTYRKSLQANKKLRHVCLTGMKASGMIGCVGQVDYAAMSKFTLTLKDKIASAKQMRMTSSLGEDISFTNFEVQPISFKLGEMTKPGTHLFVGQMGWLPQPESINGKLVFNGSVAPDIGVLTEPIEMTIEAGRIVSISGGEQAKAYENWLKGFNHPQMLGIAHTGIGFNPGACIVGSILEDQRVMGTTTWGFGSIGAGLLPPSGVAAPSHSDAVCLNTTVEADGVVWMENGVFVEPELAELVTKLKK